MNAAQETFRIVGASSSIRPTHFLASLLLALTLIAPVSGKEVEASRESPSNHNVAHSTGPAGQFHRPRWEIESIQKKISELKLKLEEYHAGKRTAEDGFVLLREMLSLYALIDVRETPEVKQLLGEYQEILARRPQLAVHPSELSDDRIAREGRDQAEAERKEKLRSWTPKDDTPITVYFYKSRVLAVYQYRIDLYEGPDKMAIPLEDGHPASSLRLPPTLSNEIAQGRARLMESIKFAERVRAIPMHPHPDNRFVLVCSSRFATYVPHSDEEYNLLRGNHLWHGQDADVTGDQCLIVAIDGKERHVIPVIDSPPTRYTEPRGISPDGKLAVLAEGTAVRDEEKSGAWHLEHCQNYVIWENPDKISRIPVSSTDRKFLLRLRTDLQGRPCPP